MGAVLLTGGTGYFGSNLAARLIREGEEVVILTRSRSRQALSIPGVRIAIGDVQDLESLRRALVGCDRVFHAAAHVRMWDRDPGLFQSINVAGLANLLRAARENGISRVVYTSSFIALGPTDGSTGDEDWNPRQRIFHNEYERTKAAADRLAREEAGKGAPLVILYPGVVYGPGPVTPGNLVGKTVSDYLLRKIPGILGEGNRRICYAYMDDVVEGHLRAMRQGNPGDRFILGGENRTLMDLFAALEQFTGIEGPRKKIPYALAEMVGRLQRWRARWTGIEPEITDEVVRIYRHEWAYSSARAQRQLGYAITPFLEGLKMTVEGIRKGMP